MSNEYKYCPFCGLKYKEDLRDNKNYLACQSCKNIFYQNSKPTVGAILLNNQQEVLLTKRNIEPFYGYWDLPGGYLDYKEHPVDGLKREIKEELSIDVKIGDFFKFYMDEYGLGGAATLNCFFLAKINSKEFKLSQEISQVEWFKLNNLPEKLAFTNNRKVLKDIKVYIDK